MSANAEAESRAGKTGKEQEEVGVELEPQDNQVKFADLVAITTLRIL
jgi:hypothetical protein